MPHLFIIPRRWHKAAERLREQSGEGHGSAILQIGADGLQPDRQPTLRASPREGRGGLPAERGQARIDLETRVRHALPVDLESTARKGGLPVDVREGRRDGHGREQHIPVAEKVTEGGPVAFALRVQADELRRCRCQPVHLRGGKGIG